MFSLEILLWGRLYGMPYCVQKVQWLRINGEEHKNKIQKQRNETRMYINRKPGEGKKQIKI
jgi:hypothetical protein